MKKKVIAVLISFILLTGIHAGVFAVQNTNANSQSGEFNTQIVDRINFSLKNTDYVLKKTKDGTETFQINFTFTAKKEEADFYAIINSFKISGIEYDNIIFEAAEENKDNAYPDSLVLSAENGTPVQYTWNATLTFTVNDKGTFSPCVEIDYTSGLTKQSASSHYLEIPLTITIK